VALIGRAAPGCILRCVVLGHAILLLGCRRGN